MCYESVSANVDMLGRLHDNNSRFFYFNPKCKEIQSLFTFLRLSMPNRMSIELFFLLNRCEEFDLFVGVINENVCIRSLH